MNLTNTWVFWFVILGLFWEIVLFSSAFSVIPPFVTVICAWICALQVISDLRQNLDLSSCVLPLQMHSSQKKIKSQVQARYLNRFIWFSKGRMRQENLNSSPSDLSGTTGYIYEPNLSCGKAQTPLFLPAWYLYNTFVSPCPASFPCHGCSSFWASCIHVCMGISNFIYNNVATSSSVLSSLQYVFHWFCDLCLHPLVKLPILARAFPLHNGCLK